MNKLELAIKLLNKIDDKVSIDPTFFGSFGKTFGKKFQTIIKMKDGKAKLKRALDLLSNAQGAMVDEQFDSLNAEIDKLFAMRESIEMDLDKFNETLNIALAEEVELLDDEYEVVPCVLEQVGKELEAIAPVKFMFFPQDCLLEIKYQDGKEFIVEQASDLITVTVYTDRKNINTHKQETTTIQRNEPKRLAERILAIAEKLFTKLPA